MENKYDLPELQEFLNTFKENDKKSVDEYNNLIGWSGASLERHVSFLSWRLSSACDLIVYLALWIENKEKP